jgi:competence protein ComEC
VNSESGNSFAANSWLANDGDGADQATAFARVEMKRKRGRAEMDVAGLGPFIYRGSKAPDGISRRECAQAAILLAPRWRWAPRGRCVFIGSAMLRREGALAIRLAEGRLEIEGARSRNRTRPWTRDPRDQ